MTKVNSYMFSDTKTLGRGILAMTLLTTFVALTPIYAKNLQNDKLSSISNTRDLRTFVPTTVSKSWRDIYKNIPNPMQTPIMPGPNDIVAWDKFHRLGEEAAEASVQKILKRYPINIKSSDYDGVPVLEITPKGWKDNGKVLVYVHGGAYTMFTARSTLSSSGPVAVQTGLRVIAIDYTNPPRAKWQEVTSQVVRVFKYLNKQGFSMNDIAIYGDSAGGGLAAGSVLKLRDEGLGLPAAVVLWSPWADITETGDSYQTLKDAEPNYIYERVLGPSADAYANKKDQKHPYVSPVYGDFRNGFSPTLIQGGTREIFLSNFVRLYQALDTSGQIVKLDLYEGMPHVFQAKSPESEESITALKKMDAFLVKYLKN